MKRGGAGSEARRYCVEGSVEEPRPVEALVEQGEHVQEELNVRKARPGLAAQFGRAVLHPGFEVGGIVRELLPGLPQVVGEALDVRQHPLDLVAAARKVAQRSARLFREAAAQHGAHPADVLDHDPVEEEVGQPENDERAGHEDHHEPDGDLPDGRALVFDRDEQHVQPADLSRLAPEPAFGPIARQQDRRGVLRPPVAGEAALLEHHRPGGQVKLLPSDRQKARDHLLARGALEGCDELPFDRVRAIGRVARIQRDAAVGEAVAGHVQIRHDLARDVGGRHALDDEGPRRQGFDHDRPQRLPHVGLNGQEVGEDEAGRVRHIFLHEAAQVIVEREGEQQAQRQEDEEQPGGELGLQVGVYHVPGSLSERIAAEAVRGPKRSATRGGRPPAAPATAPPPPR